MTSSDQNYISGNFYDPFDMNVWEFLTYLWEIDYILCFYEKVMVFMAEFNEITVQYFRARIIIGSFRELNISYLLLIFDDYRKVCIKI